MTSRPREEALFALEKFYSGLFDPSCVIALEDCKKEKPNPEPLLLAKKILKCKNPVYVGDTINDQLAAKEAGVS